MSGLGYLKQKLCEALHALVSDGHIDQRLSYAAGYFVQMQDRDVPDEYRDKFMEIKSRLTQIKLSSDRGYVPRPISTDDANELASDILSLFVRVMGGL
jgi:hypothetical protein